MPNMDDLKLKSEEKALQDARYQSAMASINQAKIQRERQGYVVMAAAMNYGEGALGEGRLGKVSHAAKLFLIAFTCALPVLLVSAYLL